MFKLTVNSIAFFAVFFFLFLGSVGCVPCGNGKFGKFCDLSCHHTCEVNGGTCNYVNLFGDDHTGVSRIDCLCPPDRFGQGCQYTCQSGNLESCAKELLKEEHCYSLLVRSRSIETTDFSQTYSGYREGFGSARCDTFPVNHQPGECFLGLDRLHAEFPESSFGASTLKFIARYQGNNYEKTCFDFNMKRSENPSSPGDYLDRIFFGQCYGDEEISNEGLEKMKQQLFSTPDYDVDDSPGSCSNDIAGGGGWFYSRTCGDIFPTGDITAEDFQKGVHIYSLTGFNSNLDALRVDVCRYGCPEGKFGYDCTLECPYQCIENGGECKLVMSDEDGFQWEASVPPVPSETVQTLLVERVECSCPVDKFGSLCQFELLGKSVEERTAELIGESECMDLVVRTRDDAATSFQKNFKFYKYGFGNCATGSCWGGLYRLMMFAPKISRRFSTLEVSVVVQDTPYRATCADVSFGGETEDFAMTVSSFCFTEPGSPLDPYDLLYHSQIGFSTRDYVVDNNPIFMCPEDLLGGWWYRNCVRAHPTGEINNPGPLKGVIFPSLTGFAQTVPVDLRIEVCRAPCPENTYGEHCHIQCADECELNGGTCEIVGMVDGDAQTATGAKCNCPKNYYGRTCGFYCAGDLEECVEGFDTERTCTPLVVRRNGVTDFNLGRTEYVRGFGDCESGDCWGGLEQIHSFLEKHETESESDGFASIEFRVQTGLSSYSKKCIHFSMDKDDGYLIDFAECVGDHSLSTDHIQHMRHAKFSTLDHDVDGNLLKNCAEEHTGGWWYKGSECHFIHPTGTYGETSGSKGVIFTSLLGNEREVDGFEIDVCWNKVHRTCQDVLVRREFDVDFNITLEEFSRGVGDCSTGDCFVSLEYLHDISKRSLVPLEMVFDVTKESTVYTSKCKFFVDEKAKGYTLNLRSCETFDNAASVGDLLFHDNLRFCTHDKDCGECAASSGGGWWFNENSCSRVFPTGEFLTMKFESLGSVSKFSVSVCGSIPYEDTQQRVDEYRGPQCKPILIRKRDGLLDFDRSYDDYVYGFGECSNECWVGLQALESATRSPKKMILDIEYKGQSYSKACQDFQVYEESGEFYFRFGQCHGSSLLTTSLLRSQSGVPFTTKDHRVLLDREFCAYYKSSGWWFDSSCAGFLPTGDFRSNERGNGVHYESLTSLSRSVSRIQMSLCGFFDDEVVRGEEYKKCRTMLRRDLDSSSDSVLFNRNYEEFISGFALKDGQSWLGLESIHILTEIPQYLDVDYQWEGELEEKNFHCAQFSVDGRGNDYEMHTNLCLGDEEEVVDKFLFHNGNSFSAYDFHPSGSSTNCALSSLGSGGWWYSSAGSGVLQSCGTFLPSHGDGAMVYASNGEFRKLKSIHMKICQVRERVPEAVVFIADGETELQAKSCSVDCGEFAERTFDLSDGEHLYIFPDAWYSGSTYQNMFTGPMEGLVMDGSVPSFFTSMFELPIIFKEKSLKFLDVGGNPSPWMYVRDDCGDIQKCGWDVSARIGSAYVPRYYNLTLYTQKFSGMDLETVDMYEMRGPHVDRDMAFDQLSWTVDYAPVEKSDDWYPTLFKRQIFSEDQVEMRYDCKSDCGVEGYRSLFVPSGYVVKLFSQIDHQGVSREFVGPKSLLLIDGYFGKHDIKSYISDIIKIVKIEVNILRFDFSAADGAAEEVHVNQIEVMNPTSLPREMKFVDTYKTYEMRYWNEEQFVEEGFTDETTIEISSDYTFDTYEMEWDTFNSDSNVVYHFGVPEFPSEITLDAAELLGSDEEEEEAEENATDIGSNATNATLGNETGLNPPKSNSTQPQPQPQDTGGSERETSGNLVTSLKFEDSVNTEHVLYFAVESGSEDGAQTSREETKSFHYSCLALPYTKTTCQAKQMSAVIEIPYEAELVFYFNDGTRDYQPFKGVLQNSAATTVYFLVLEEVLTNRCGRRSFPMGTGCLKPLKMVEDVVRNELVAGLVSPTDISYSPMDYTVADQLCFVNGKGSEIATVHGDVDNFYFSKMCEHDYPIFTGVRYLAETDEHVTSDRSEFSYHRFRGVDFLKPGVDSYVVIHEDGFWKYIPSTEKVGMCVVCKKETAFV